VANKYIGILYIRIEGGLYKIASIKAGADGSIYIATPLGAYHKGNGIDGNKFTYHPDGKSWMTSELRLKDFGVSVPDEVLRQLEGWKSSGLGIKNGKLYTRDFDVKVPLAEVKEMISLKYGISYSNIKTLDHKRLMAEATNQRKINMATVIDGRLYTNLSLHFFVVGSAYLNDGLERLGIAEKHYFKHPALDLYVIVAATDEWAGDKENK
jgi:hypothetical protein